MKNHNALSKIMFLSILVLMAVCLTAMPAWAKVWQSGSTDSSVTINWSNPPVSEMFYVEDDVFKNYLYNSDYNKKKTDGLFDDIRDMIPVANVLSITVEWGQNGFQHFEVLNAVRRSFEITGLTSYSSYDVRVTYKFLMAGNDGKLHVGPLGTTVAVTSVPQGTVENQILKGGSSYNASDLGYGNYVVWEGDQGQKTCTINMDRDLTVEAIEILNGVTLKLTGSRTLTVRKNIGRRIRNFTGYVWITEDVSVNIGEFFLDGIDIDTTGKVTIRPYYYPYGSSAEWRCCFGMQVKYVSITNGTVSIVGDKDTSFGVSCEYFSLAGGSVTIRNVDHGIRIDDGGDCIVTTGSGGRNVHLSVTAREEAVEFIPHGNLYDGLRLGDLIIKSPVALTTPAGGSTKIFNDLGARFVVDAGGNIAKQVVISIPLAYTVEASLENSSINVGDSTQMKYKTKASDFSTVTGSVYRFTSDDEKVATVDANGLVKGVGLGKTKITVTDTAHGNVSAALEVTVKGISGNFTVGSFRYKVANGVATLTGPKNKNAKSLKIPATIKIKGQKIPVNKIGKNAFKGMPNLTSLTIGKNVKSIGANAMRNCRKLKYITIRTIYLTDKSVGANAFKNLKAIVYVKCPKGKVKAYEIWLYKKGLKKGTKVK